MPRGGARKGAGKKKGTKHKKTLEREAALKVFQERVMKNAEQLYSAQHSLAVGQAFLFRIDTVTEGKKRTKEKPVLVTDEAEIRDYLDGEHDRGPDAYYYITTKEPNNMALDSLLNRAVGKPKESVDITGDGAKGIVNVYIVKHDKDGNEHNASV